MKTQAAYEHNRAEKKGYVKPPHIEIHHAHGGAIIHEVPHDGSYEPKKTVHTDHKAIMKHVEGHLKKHHGMGKSEPKSKHK